VSSGAIFRRSINSFKSSREGDEVVCGRHEVVNQETKLMSQLLYRNQILGSSTSLLQNGLSEANKMYCCLVVGMMACLTASGGCALHIPPRL
jgi:hypothetical protein